MKGLISEILTTLTYKDQIAILMMDQSKVGNRFEYLLVPLRLGERAITVSWRVKKTQKER